MRTLRTDRIETRCALTRTTPVRYTNRVPFTFDPVRLGDAPLTLEAIASVARGRAPVVLGAAARVAMQRSRGLIDSVVARGDEAPAVYGVNTGFGALAEVRISAAQVRALQQN